MLKGFFDRKNRLTPPAVPTSIPQEMLDKIQQQRHDYVKLCSAHVAGNFRADREKAAFDEFLILATDPRIVSIIVDAAGRALHLGTRLVIIKDHDGIPRRIGEFIISMRQNPLGFKCINISNGLIEQPGKALVHQHPHITASGDPCMPDDRDKITDSIAEGRFLFASRMLIATVHTADSYAYRDVTEWPLYLEGA